MRKLERRTRNLGKIKRNIKFFVQLWVSISLPRAWVSAYLQSFYIVFNCLQGSNKLTWVRYWQGFVLRPGKTFCKIRKSEMRIIPMQIHAKNPQVTLRDNAFKSYLRINVIIVGVALSILFIAAAVFFYKHSKKCIKVSLIQRKGPCKPGLECSPFSTKKICFN